MRRDPATGANAIEIAAPDLAAAQADAQRVAALPQVAQARTLADLIPADQDKKLALIRQMAAAIERPLNSAQTRPPPSDQDNIAALQSTAGTLSQFATDLLAALRQPG